MLVHVLILNYNGRALMAECLPSVLCAADRSGHRCRVAVIDNDSTDDSIAWLRRHFAEVSVIRRPNRGLCSFNDVLGELPGPVALLLNNDIKLDPACIDPLVAPLMQTSPCFMTAPQCWLFDGETYEGFRTAIRWHWGLVRATALYAGHESGIALPGLTASAGAALAVDCRKFAELGGFDPIYLPGRLEDLDFAFRGYLAGYYARYVPEAVAYHRGMSTFGEVFGREACDRLALRNTLLFQWKNLRHPRHVVRQLLALPLRAAWDVYRSLSPARGQRFVFVRALLAALARIGQLRTSVYTEYRTNRTTSRERAFFGRFHPKRMSQPAKPERIMFLRGL